MNTKLFRTKAEIITLVIISFSITWLFTPIVEHIYETTAWDKISIEEFNNRIDKYREDVKKEQEEANKNKQKDLN